MCTLYCCHFSVVGKKWVAHTREIAVACNSDSDIILEALRTADNRHKFSVIRGW